MAEKFQARVVCPRYGSALKNEIVEVEQREIDRVSPLDASGKRVYDVLIPLEEEARQRDEALKPQPIDDTEARRERDARAGWDRLGQASTARMRAINSAQAKRAREIAIGTPEK